MYKQIDNSRLGMLSGAPSEPMGVSTQETIRGLLDKIENMLLASARNCAEIEQKLLGLSQCGGKEPVPEAPEQSVGVLVSRIGALASALETQTNRISGAL